MPNETNFISGSKVIRQILSNEVDAVNADILSRFVDVYRPGVVEGLLQMFVLTAGGNSTATSPSVTVGTGVAYNINGERILISNATVPYNSANPSTTTPDGIGGSTATPQSTGSANVPLPINANTFVWIDYLLTIDPASFTLHKVTSQKLFYKNLDGYKVGLSTSAITPPAGFSSAAILLGLVTTNSTLTNGIATISQVLMPLFGTQADRVLVTTPQSNRSDATVTYSFGQTVFVDDHVKAVGSNPVTANNPHGLSAGDLGITDPGGLEHQQFLHTNGIISPSIGGNASALFLQEHTSGIASENFVEVFPLLSNEVAVVHGVTFDSTSVPSTIQFSFVDTNGNSLPNGVHTIYLDSNDRAVKRALPGAFNLSDVTLQRIWDIQWTSPTLQSSLKNDYRLFGTLGPQNMRFELLGGLVSGLATGNRSLTFTYDINNNITQIGVGGDNGTIAGSITLITFAYNLSNQVVLVGASYGHRLLTTIFTYSGNTITSVTETVI